MSKCCVRVVVTGKVQGVGFRRAAQERALKANLTGHARNLPDGRVEVLLCGEGGAVNAVSEWLGRGPDHARVTHIETEGVEWRDRDAFLTL